MQKVAAWFLMGVGVLMLAGSVWGQLDDWSVYTVVMAAGVGVVAVIAGWNLARSPKPNRIQQRLEREAE